HARIAEDLRVDEDDVDHGEESRDAGDELGADVAAALAQAEIAIEKRSLARRLGCVGHVTPPSRLNARRAGPQTRASARSGRSRTTIAAKRPGPRLSLIPPSDRHCE